MSKKPMMDKYTSTLLLLISIAPLMIARGTHRYEYYWKSFEGIIPPDAVVAGYDNEEPVYIGQATTEDKLIPGTIYQGDANVYYEWEEQPWATSKGVQILCTQQPRNFGWLPTTNTKLFQFSKKFVVNGGYQLGLKTYIGRVRKNKDTIIGKVMCSDSYCLAMYGVKDGKPVEYHSYEVLQYVPENFKSVVTNRLPAFWTIF